MIKYFECLYYFLYAKKVSSRRGYTVCDAGGGFATLGLRIKNMRENLMRDLIRLKRKLNLSLKKYIFRYTVCFFFMLIYTATSVLFPGTISLVINNGIISGGYGKTLKYIFIFLCVGIMMTVFQYLEQMSFIKLSQDILLYIKKVVYSKLMKTNIRFWSDHKIGDVMSVVESDISKVETLLTTQFCDAIVSVLVIFGMSIFLIYLDLRIGLLLLLSSFLFVLIQRKVANVLRNKMWYLREMLGKTSTVVNESLNNLQNIQIIGYTKLFIEKFKASNENVKKSYIKHIEVASISSGIANIYVVFSMLIVLLGGAFKFYQGTLNIGVFLTLVLYAQRLYSPINSICNTYTSVKNITPSILKILDILETKDTLLDGELVPITNICGNIEFKSVFFRYSEESKYIFENASFSINAGEIVGIIGENGSGKTTIVKLLAGLCKQESGYLTIDGIALERYNLEFLNRQIGYVMQRDYLVSGKLSDMLKFENDITWLDIKDELINGFGFDISKFTDGWDTYIDENSKNISGGEMQKISLIRLFSSMKQVYILDEPTSFMDIVSENKVCDKLQSLLKGKTAIIITHRPKILKICSRVIDLNNL